MQSDYTGQRGMRYLGAFKPTVPYVIGHGLTIVPSGWGFFEIPAFPGEHRANISYVVGAETLSDDQLIAAYRDLLIFDAFVMNDYSAICYYDANMLQLGVVATGVEASIDALNDGGYNQIDYANITPQVFGGLVENQVPPLGYAELYESYCNLKESDKEIIEWFAIKPRAAPKRDGFANSNYWQLLHLNVLLEDIIRPPPYCTSNVGCILCGGQPPRHHSISWRNWLRQQLSTRIAAAPLAEKYAKVVEAARGARHKIAHVPHFDRSRMPVLQLGDSVSYDTTKAIAVYRDDSVALSTLIASLGTLARSLVLDKLFMVKYYHEPLTGWASSSVSGA